MRIKFGHISGKTLTYGVQDEAGAVVVAEGQSLPEIGSTGYYTVVDANIATGDVVPVKEGAIVRGFGVADENIAIETTIASKTSDSVFVLTDRPNSSPADDNFYRFMAITVMDITGRVTATRRIISYVASTRTVTVDNEFRFSIAAGDVVRIWADTYSATATAAAAAEIADAVWDETANDHITAGTTGRKLNHIQGGFNA